MAWFVSLCKAPVVTARSVRATGWLASTRLRVRDVALEVKATAADQQDVPGSSCAMASHVTCTDLRAAHGLC